MRRRADRGCRLMNAAPPQRYRLLVADDEPALLGAYRRVFRDFLADGDEDAASDFDQLSAELFAGAPAGPEQHEDPCIEEVTYHRQGEAAVAAVEAACAEGRPFAMAFLDMRMPPGIDGLETARRIRAVDPDINILIVTGYSDHRPGEIARVVGSPDKLFYLVKPFEPSEMRQLTRALTSRWANERRLKGDLQEGISSIARLRAKLEASIERESQLAETAEVRQRNLNAALANLPHGLCIFDAEKRLILCNARYAEMYGLPPELVRPGTSLRTIVEHRRRIGNAPKDVPNYVTHAGVDWNEEGNSIFEFPLEDGRIIRINHLSMGAGGYVATHEDVTEAIRTKRRISHMARHDALTDLPNRTFFREKLQDALKGVSTESRVAVLCLDLDDFKGVNDTLGHPTGDALLAAVAERLRECAGGVETVARLGGDEFAVLQSGRTQPAAATDLARRIIEAVGRPFELHGHQVVTGATIGIAFAPEDGDDPDRLLKNADMALYRAKGAGRGTHSFFEPSMDANMQARRRVEMGLRRALAHDEFELHYQPVVNLKDNAVAGFEALLRWKDPQRGLISPAEFIPVAEDTGLIVPIGDWDNRHACAEAATWPGDLTVAVNLSPAQFRGHRLTHVVFAALAEARLPARRLELEITESVLLNNNEATLATLHQLRDFGARISMDDFGTGYSSLSYLRSFPFDKIKIDQSFIRDLGGSDDSLAIVRAVTGLGAALGMRTTAEGVETAEQLEYLRREGCTEVQGFLFSRPRPSGELFADRIPLADVAA
jgi:diguanylate cyclase (GGDEF)-like protein